MSSSTPAVRRHVGVAADHPGHCWWVLSVASPGMFLATVNSGTLLTGLTGLVLGLSDAGLDGWTAPMVIIGLTPAVICLPIVVEVESRVEAPMLDLSLFGIQVYSAAAAAAFLNGLARFALMFLFVLYFQGPQEQDPITAGLMLAPLAICMLFASPLAGAWSDRHGSRAPGGRGHAADRRSQ
jgi:hypothetical protein